jgi:hypothetical protein
MKKRLKMLIKATIGNGLRVKACCETMTEILQRGFSIGPGNSLIISSPDRFLTDGYRNLVTSTCPRCSKPIQIVK